MDCITWLFDYPEQVNIALWPRFKMVFDMHLSSLRNANVKTLWEDDVHPHYVMRRYAEFTASLIHLNVEYGDGQVGQITITGYAYSLFFFVSGFHCLTMCIYNDMFAA